METTSKPQEATVMRFAIDPRAMLQKCRRLQWSIGDVEWDAPGAELVTTDNRAAMSGFMGDLYWIESIAAIVLRAMSQTAEDSIMSQIFSSFAVDEQRHADAELMLMRRWKMIGRSEQPTPNVNARNLMLALERAAGRVHPAVYSAIIPFTELVLDGALVKHLNAKVKDPVCGEVFRQINADEARHLAIDFYCLERFALDRPRENRTAAIKALAEPLLLYALFFGYLPLLSRMRPNIDRIGITEAQLMECIERYIALGDESPIAAKHNVYALFRVWSRRIVAGRSVAGDTLMRLSDLCEALDLKLPGASRWGKDAGGEIC